MSVESRYAEARARFFPVPVAVVNRALIPPLLIVKGLASSPTESDVERAGVRAWSFVRREAQRLAVLAIYSEGVTHGREHPVSNEAISEVMRSACRTHSITIPELRGRGRARSIIAARREVSMRLRKEFGLSLMMIASVLQRDHTSIMNLLKPKPWRRAA